MALRLDPNGVGVGIYQDRGNARREEGDWAGALADYDRAIALQPRRAELYVARGWARLGSGRRVGRQRRPRLPLAQGLARSVQPVHGDAGGPRRPRHTPRGRGAPAARRGRRQPPAPRPGRCRSLHYLRGDIDEADPAPRRRRDPAARRGPRLHRARPAPVRRPRQRPCPTWSTPATTAHRGSIAADVARAAIGRIAPGGSPDRESGVTRRDRARTGEHEIHEIHEKNESQKTPGEPNASHRGPRTDTGASRGEPELLRIAVPESD